MTTQSKNCFQLTLYSMNCRLKSLCRSFTPRALTKKRKKTLKTTNSTKKPKKIPSRRPQSTATSLSNSRPKALQKKKTNLTLKYGKNFSTNGKRKKNGDEYEAGTLTCLLRSIQRYFNTHGSQANLIQGDEFKLSREVLSAKRKQLVVERGKGNRPQASREVTAVEEDKLFRLFA